MNDKWNVRLWLRDWLNKPSNAVLADPAMADSRVGPNLDADARMCGVGAEIEDRRASSRPPSAQLTASPSPCPLKKEGVPPDSSELRGSAGTSDHP